MVIFIPLPVRMFGDILIVIYTETYILLSLKKLFLCLQIILMVSVGSLLSEPVNSCKKKKLDEADCKLPFLNDPHFKTFEQAFKETVFHKQMP